MRNLDLDTEYAQRNIRRHESLISRKLLVKEDKIAKKQDKSNDNDLTKTKQLWKLVDELNDKLSSITACKSGCSECCHITVSVTQIEAEIIAKKTGLPLNDTVSTTFPDYQGQPCPFLQDNKCSIYDVRPLLCRKHVSFFPDEYWCKHLAPDDRSFPMLNFTEIIKAMGSIVDRTMVKDIRQWFGNQQINKTFY